MRQMCSLKRKWSSPDETQLLPSHGGTCEVACEAIVYLGIITWNRLVLTHTPKTQAHHDDDEGLGVGL